MKQLDADVLVAGGGTAGVFAAISAAEEGAKVVLVERDGQLGGVGVRAGIHYYFYGSLGGAQMDIDQSTREVAKEFGGKARGFHPEAKGMAISLRIEELGIQVIYNAVVADVIKNGNRLVGAIVESEDEPIEIRAEVTIDSTADGDVACLAGAEYKLGREWDGVTHTYSLAPRYLDDRNVLQYKNFDIGWVDSTDVWDVSRGFKTGRQYAWRNDEDPTRNHYIVVGPQLGIREGRIVTGEYVLHQDDMLWDRHFDDVVMRCFAHHDTHTYDYANESGFTQIYIPVLGMRKFPFGGEVPYRCFVPKAVDGLLIGCRALSQDHDCSMTLRMQRDMQKAGEVVGRASALSVKNGVAPRNVDVGMLQSRLIASGLLKESDLTRESEPWMLFENETVEHRLEMLEAGKEEEHLDLLIGYLGTDQEDKALWWIWQLGEDCAPALLKALPSVTGKKLRGLILALGLVKHPESSGLLAEIVKSGDKEKKPDPLTCSEERWLAALILLKEMKDSAAVPDVIPLLHTERKSTAILYLLHYLIAVADELTKEQRAQTIEAIGSLLQEPELGTDYFVKGSHGITPTKGDSTSIRWSIEIASAYLLERIGGNGQSILQRYLEDRRGYARTAASTMLKRLNEGKGGVSA